MERSGVIGDEHAIGGVGEGGVWQVSVVVW